MKVLMTADTVGGVWTYAVDLARALGPHGVHVALATMGRRLTEGQREQLRPLRHIKLYESGFDLEWMPDPWDDVRSAGGWLERVARAVKPDVVHLNNYAHAHLDLGAPKIVVAHSCVCSWWEAVHAEDAPAEWNEYRRAVRRGLEHADAIIAPTRAMADMVVRRHGDDLRVGVIDNFRDRAPFAPAPKKDMIFAAGRLWDRAKNLSVLDAAAEGLGWPVHVAGPLTGEDGSRARAHHAVTLGRLSPDEVAHRLGEAAIYALPARYEPFGLSALEAALCGCALVLGDIPTLRELWDGAAVFIDPNSPDDLRRALAALIDDADRRRSLAREAALRARRFTPERAATAYLNLYTTLGRGEPLDAVAAGPKEHPCAS